MAGVQPASVNTHVFDTSSPRIVLNASWNHRRTAASDSRIETRL
jgi:hypothetical protein